MKKVYIETSIFSYLAAKRSANLVAAAWQNITFEWWEIRRHCFECFISQLVMREAMRGDPAAAALRFAFIENVPQLEITNDTVRLAEKILRAHVLPKKATDDALHIAIAAIHGMDYLLTWNCRHINNAEIKPGIRDFIFSKGLRCPEICTPEELTGE
jgi:predicted nucleic acid-binding protein